MEFTDWFIIGVSICIAIFVKLSSGTWYQHPDGTWYDIDDDINW